jgi:hypothetical protein
LKAEIEINSMSTEFYGAIADKVLARIKPVLSAGNAKGDESIFDVKGLSSYLHVSEAWIYERSRLSEIPKIKLNGVLLFKKQQIDKWLDEQSTPSVCNTKLPRR